MNTAEAMAVMRSIEPMWRDGMTPEEFEEESKEVAAWDVRMDLHRQAGNRPKSEQLIDHKTARRLEKQAARNRKYRQNKKSNIQPCVTQSTS